MGMFDRIHCEVPLPGSPPVEIQTGEFQTKSLECLLDDFTITSGGLLIKDVYDLEEDNTPRELTGSKILDTLPRWKRINERKEIVDFHGDIFFYNNTGKFNDPSDPVVWYEYTARFTNGKLQHIVQGGSRWDY